MMVLHSGTSLLTEIMMMFHVLGTVRLLKKTCCYENKILANEKADLFTVRILTFWDKRRENFNSLRIFKGNMVLFCDTLHLFFDNFVRNHTHLSYTEVLSAEANTLINQDIWVIGLRKYMYFLFKIMFYRCKQFIIKINKTKKMQ